MKICAAVVCLSLSLAMAADTKQPSKPKEALPPLDQTVVVVQEGPGRVVLFPSDQPLRRTVVPVGEKPHEVELSPDGRTAYISNFGLLEVNHKVGTPGTTVSVIDVQKAVERARFHLPAGVLAPHGLKLRPPQHRELFTNGEEGLQDMVVFDANSGEVLRHFPLPPGVHNFVFDDAGSAVYAFTMTNRVVRLDPERGTVTASANISSPRGLAWTADRKFLIAGCKGEVLLLDPKTLAVKSRFGQLGAGQIFYPSVTSDGKWILAPAVLDGVVLVMDAANGKVAHRIPAGSPLQVVIDGTKAWVANVLVPPAMLPPNADARNGGVDQLDLTSFQPMAIPGLPDVNGIAITPASTGQRR